MTVRTIAAIADSDSYLKYAVHFLDQLKDWRRQVVVVRSHVIPTSVQTRAALAGTFLEGRPPAVVPVRKLSANLNPMPDVVLIAATGPIAREVLIHFASLKNRPALITALPGIAFPATSRALGYRELADTFMVHSLAEADTFAILGEKMSLDGITPRAILPSGSSFDDIRTTTFDDASASDADATGADGLDPERPAIDEPDPADAPEIVKAAQERGETPAPPLEEEIILPPSFAVGRLPMLNHHEPPAPDETPVTRIVFAPQAKMPFEESERLEILKALAETKRQHPDVEVIVKLRALRGEPQTHIERFPYDYLWEKYCAETGENEHLLDFQTGSLAERLTPGTALVTVSSTAAIEAIDLGLRVGIISDFGVTEKLLNAMFSESGLLMALDEMQDLDIPHANQQWLRRNYFHTPDDVAAAHRRDMEHELVSLADASRKGYLDVSATAMARARTRAWRARLKTALPAPVLKVARNVRNAVRT
ncbi:DUF6716 putative glycosyltransferase [Pseudoglutamicibacter cumminsii]|uniref:DUF6716 putative glycosyltransferase n=1 Tax=Pseudoglutamicibacter cumminsii TaxID=156979 RepID=UPI00195DE076|nr:DUF6716 putative glycosyltransferase [Pseudoglutamicibacter cumminsii]MBM7795924.1 hypothetical protein [Pseudoglutamicibacter cumminsii]